MCDSAALKMDRAAKGIRELGEFLRERRPFTYVVETDTRTCQRATFARKDRSAIDAAAVLSGEVVHNLRSALDHAYWEIVSPFATNEQEEKKVQFPFCRSADRLERTLKDRLADRVSPEFLAALQDLKPCRGAGGNEALYLVDEMNVLDKHRLLIPTGDYTRISSEMLKPLLPDFPPNLSIVDCHFGGNRRDLAWNAPREILARIDLGSLRAPTLHQYEKELDVPVEVVFLMQDHRLSLPVISTLNAMTDTTRRTIEVVRRAAL